jgi:hypothetical protein
MQDLWKDDVRQVTNALIQLGMLCFLHGSRTEADCKKNREHIFECGGHAVIVETLERFPGNMDVQQWVCCVVNAALCGLPERFQKAAGTIGLVEAVVKAMLAFPQFVVVQSISIAAMSGLVSYGENAERFVKASGIEAVVAAMTRFSADSKIETLGCYLVLSCAEFKYERQLIELDALTMVGKALKNHLETAQVTEHARLALTALAKAD